MDVSTIYFLFFYLHYVLFFKLEKKALKYHIENIEIKLYLFAPSF